MQVKQCPQYSHAASELHAEAAFTAASEVDILAGQPDYYPQGPYR